MLGCDYPKIHARHIEAPARRYLCESHHAAYRPDGFSFSFPAEHRREWVLVETSEGTLTIARYHHFRPGSGFGILAAPPAYIKGVRRLLAESETANVVWLPPHRSR